MAWLAIIPLGVTAYVLYLCVGAIVTSARLPGRRP